MNKNYGTISIAVSLEKNVRILKILQSAAAKKKGLDKELNATFCK